MSDYFVFDGVDSRAFDALVFDRTTFQSPQKDYTAVAIPGRSGDFLLDNRRFLNVEHEYSVIIPQYFEDNFEAFRAFIMSRNGYCRLFDSIHPNEFYSAYVSDPLVPTLTRDRGAGKFVIRFMRKPQRWLLSGEEEETVLVDDYITNPTQFSTLPLLKLTRSDLRDGFKFRLNTTEVLMYAQTDEASAYLNSYPLYIDFETLQAYVIASGTRHYFNSVVRYTIASGDKNAFKLSPGNNNFTSNSGSDDTGTYEALASIDIVPRWYTI